MPTEDDRKRDDSSYSVFREAADMDELRRLFELRYREYRDAGLGDLVPENDYGIDVNSYDLRSHHFGLFNVCPDGHYPIGYLRVVEDREPPARSDLDRLLEQVPGLRHMTQMSSPNPLPLMDYVPNIHVMTALYDAIRSRGEHLVEVSRFVLDARFRSLKLARHMVESAIAILAFHHHFEHAVWCCDSPCKKFYGLYGFRPVAGIEDGDFLKIGTSSSCLVGSVTNIPRSVVPRLALMARTYAATGGICFFREEPDLFISHAARNLPAPHAQASSVPQCIEVACAVGQQRCERKKADQDASQRPFANT
ncbi:MAG: hypothetical protein ABIJ00_16275 [Candidatus Eisenbacteria bacterium]